MICLVGDTSVVVAVSMASMVDRSDDEDDEDDDEDGEKDVNAKDPVW